MERNLVGYGPNPPKVEWPGNARIAVSFVLNFEEGSESNILDGDPLSEGYLTDIPGVNPVPYRHLSSESVFEYGSRAGIWRLLRLFENTPLTVFATGLALERNPEVAKALRHHEIAGHGYRWINYREMDKTTERNHIQKTVQIIEKVTGKKPAGWYTGRKSLHTRELVIEAGMIYDSDSYADDLPYWEKGHLIIPYQLDTNDMRYSTTPGWSSGQDFLQYLKQTFDCLYHEGGKMMTIGLHPRLSGRPGRAEVVREFLDYIQTYDQVWIVTRKEIADFWYRNHHGI